MLCFQPLSSVIAYYVEIDDQNTILGRSREGEVGGQGSKKVNPYLPTMEPDAIYKSESSQLAK